MRKRIVATVLSVIAIGTTTFSQNALAAIALKEDPKVARNRSCKEEPGTYCYEPWAPLVTIGPGIPAVSFRFDGQIGILDKIAPAEIGFNFKQRTYYGMGKGGNINLSLWRVALGLTFGKSADQSGASFGAYVMPWGIQVNNFSLGLALGYNATGKLESKLANWSVIVPLSYTVQF